MNATYWNQELVRNDQYRPEFTKPSVVDLDPIDRLDAIASIEFACHFEEEFARTLNQHGIAWQYKTRTFAVEWDEDGNFVDSLTPSFFLPAQNLYLELVPHGGRRFVETARKVRLLQQQYPTIRIDLLCVDSNWRFS